MGLSKELADRLQLKAYPRSATYDSNWMLENLMGPSVLWLAESLCEVMSLQPHMRVLDMGCGKAIGSIFLAKEFGVQVWATDLWISATDNWSRVTAAGLEDLVFPIQAEAHALPYAAGFFDALVSFDAYHYFGTDNLYLAYYTKFLKSGGQIGVVVPGLQREFDDGLPEHLAPYWIRDFWSLHSPDWWRRHWERSGQVEGIRADSVPHGWKEWLLWMQVCGEGGSPTDVKEMAMLEADGGRNLGFTRVVARRRSD